MLSDGIESVFNCDGIPLRISSGFDELSGTEVASEHNHTVSEVYGITLSVRESAIVHHLQQDIQDFWMSFLDLVKKNNSISLLSNGLGELSGLIITNVARGRSYETRYGMLFGVLGHIDSDKSLLCVKQFCGQRLCQMSLTRAGAAKEQEGAQRLLSSRKIRSGA